MLKFLTRISVIKLYTVVLMSAQGVKTFYKLLSSYVARFQWTTAFLMTVLCELFEDLESEIECSNYGFVYGSVRMTSCYVLIIVNIIGVPVRD